GRRRRADRQPRLPGPAPRGRADGRLDARPGRRRRPDPRGVLPHQLGRARPGAAAHPDSGHLRRHGHGRCLHPPGRPILRPHGRAAVEPTALRRAVLRGTAAISGVRHVTAVYTALSTSDLSVEMRTGTRTLDPLGIAVINPASYGALAKDTPWPDFPAAALAK